MKTGLRVAVCLLWVAFAIPAEAPPPPSSFSTKYQTVLARFVDGEGQVDYAGLKKDPFTLDAFAISLELLDPKVYEGWDEKGKIAFWVNAYNALTLKAIIDHYPIQPPHPDLSYPLNSIRQITGVWDQAPVVVMGRRMTLGDIENKRLRGEFHEPRIHVALVCAARSCPKLRNEPYEGPKLDRQLDDQARAFLSDARNFRIDRARGEVHASEIFKWYADDFLAAPVGSDRAADEKKALAAFAGKYLGDEDRKFLGAATYRLSYVAYDWTLNEQTH